MKAAYLAAVQLYFRGNQVNVSSRETIRGTVAMTSIIHDVATEYRHRAEEARAQVSLATDERVRQNLLQIADTWERMARYEEQNNPQRHLWQRGEQS
jgi:hypothetical protein